MATPRATREEVTAARRPYQPFGAALQLMHDRSPEILLSGPAGTGKTRANLEKLHICAENYAGMRALIVRKTRASLTESVLVTYEDRVLPVGHECLDGPMRTHRQAYTYRNGSSIVCGGMDKATRTLSTEYDLIYIAEAIELSEDDHEMLIRPLRHGKMPYQQLIADTNPDKPTHWLKKRCESGRTKMLESRHEDNPLIWDRAKNSWTEQGALYIAKLDSLTGPRKQRLRFGRWVQAEGVVYEGWDAARHVIDRFDIPRDWPRALSIDFGFTNPFVCQWWAVDPDGRLYLYREIYHTRRLVEDHAARIKELSASDPPIRAIVCDHDAEGRATLERYLGMATIPAVKGPGDKTPGIEAVAKRLRKTSDGKPRLFILRDGLDEHDPDLMNAKKPCCTAEEFDGYVWDTRGGRRRGEVPVKEDDHGADALRYFVWGLDCGERVETETEFETYRV